MTAAAGAWLEFHCSYRQAGPINEYTWLRHELCARSLYIVSGATGGRPGNGREPERAQFRAAYRGAHTDALLGAYLKRC